MLNNALNLLLCWVRNNVDRTDAPVGFFHQNGGDTYQIIVQRLPKQEQAAA